MFYDAEINDDLSPGLPQQMKGTESPFQITDADVRAQRSMMRREDEANIESDSSVGKIFNAQY